MNNVENLLFESIKNNDMLNFYIALSTIEDINAKIHEATGMAALMTAITYHASTDMVTAILERGADPNTETKKGNTPLTEATSSGDVELVKLLLRYKANPNYQTWRGRTVLHYAVMHRHLDIIKTCLDAGADPLIADLNIKTAYSHAKDLYDGEEVQKVLKNHQVKGVSSH